MEKVQRRVTKLLPSLKNLSYKERLFKLNIPTLKYKQMRGDQIQLYKVKHKLEKLSFQTYYHPSKTNTTREHQEKILNLLQQIDQGQFFEVSELWLTGTHSQKLS